MNIVVNTTFLPVVKEDADGIPYIYIEEMEKETENVIDHMSFHLKEGTTYDEASEFADLLKSKIDHINFNFNTT